MFKSYKGYLLSVFLIMLLTVIGCSEQTDETATDESEKKGEAEEGDKLSDQSVLNIAIDSTPPTLDQPMTVSTAARDVSRLIFESLVTTDDDFKPIPMLADSIDVSEDNKVYTFHLRQGIQFHNGKEMIAEDVIASMKRWEEKTALSGEAFNGAVWEEEDDYTVVLKLAKPSPIMLDTIATTLYAPAIMPKEIVESAPAEGVTEYIGTGPYQFVDWKEDQYIHVTKNEHYKPAEMAADGLGGKKEAFINDIYIHFVTDSSTRLAGLLSGEYDFAYSIPLDNYEQLNNTDNIEPILTPGTNPNIIFNKAEGIASDFEFRKIVNTALDYEAIMMAAFTDEKFYWLDSSYIHRDVTDWASQAGSEYHNINDPEKAKQMLKDYGYNGKEVVIIATRDIQWIYNIGVAVEEQLRRLGMNTRLDVFDYAAFNATIEKTDQWDIQARGSSVVSTPPQLFTLSTTWSGGVHDSHITESLVAIETAPTVEGARNLWEDLQLYVWEEHLPIVNFGVSKSLLGVNKKVEGVDNTAVGPVWWNAKVKE